MMTMSDVPGQYISFNGHAIFGYSRFLEFYRDVVNNAEDGAVFVEVGSFLGQSAAGMGALIRSSGKLIRFDAIDQFEISELSDASHAKVIEDHGGDFLAAFKHNIESAQVADVVNCVKASSIEASKIYKDRSISFIMIDASHSYQDVVDDINAWYPKLKLGGIMSGDDLDWHEVKQAVEDTCKNYKHSSSTWWFRKQCKTLAEHRALIKLE